MFFLSSLIDSLLLNYSLECFRDEQNKLSRISNASHFYRYLSYATIFLGALKPLLPSGPLGCLTTLIFFPPLAASSKFMVFNFEIKRSGLLDELKRDKKIPVRSKRMLVDTITI